MPSLTWFEEKIAEMEKQLADWKRLVVSIKGQDEGRPTQHAYTKVCVALNKHISQEEKLKAEVAALEVALKKIQTVCCIQTKKGACKVTKCPGWLAAEALKKQRA